MPTDWVCNKCGTNMWATPACPKCYQTGSEGFRKDERNKTMKRRKASRNSPHLVEEGTKPWRLHKPWISKTREHARKETAHYEQEFKLMK